LVIDLDRLKPGMVVLARASSNLTDRQISLIRLMYVCMYVRVCCASQYVFVTRQRPYSITSCGVSRTRHPLLRKAGAITLLGAYRRARLEQIRHSMYVCMYKDEPKTGPSTATFNALFRTKVTITLILSCLFS
jgi:hypothetical protein